MPDVVELPQVDVVAGGDNTVELPQVDVVAGGGGGAVQLPDLNITAGQSYDEPPGSHEVDLSEPDANAVDFGDNVTVLDVVNITADNVTVLDTVDIFAEDVTKKVVPDKRPMHEVLKPELTQLEIAEADYFGDPARTLIANANPTEFEDAVETEWQRFSPPGASYSRMHFSNTKNHTIEMDLHWFVREDRMSAKGNSQVVLANSARELVLSWNHPDYTSDGWSKGPPVLVLMWPPTIQFFLCVLVECRIRNLKFSADGNVLRWVASVKFEQVGGFDREVVLSRREALFGTDSQAKAAQAGAVVAQNRVPLGR